MNAEILQSEGDIIMEESCLSVPGIHAQIKRLETIMLRYDDVEQKNHERYYSGIISHVIEHELDHVNGN